MELIKPSEAVALLRSKDVDTRIRGILESSKLIRATPSKDYMPGERLECATLPRRLYELVFSEYPHEGREAAYALVSTSNSYKHEFVGFENYSELDNERRSVLGQSIVELITTVSGLEQLTTLEARRNGRDENGTELVKLTIDSTRALPLEIDGKRLLLPELEQRPNFLEILTESNCRVLNKICKELTGEEKLLGYIFRGTAEMTCVRNPQSKNRVALWVLHPYGVKKFEVPIIE